MVKCEKKGLIDSSDIEITDENLKNLLNNIDEFEYDPSKFWSPDIFIENAISVSEMIKYKMEIVEKDRNFYQKYNQAHRKQKPIHFASNLTVRVQEIRRVTGIFYERLELNHFPIDLQEISIRLSSKKSMNEVLLIDNRLDRSNVDLNGFWDGQQYDLLEHVDAKRDCIKDEFRKIVRPQFIVSAFVVRKIGYYFYNALTLILLITSISFTAFSFSPLDPQFRCQVIALLMLTLVNFRWVITQRLPSVSYLTMLDKYSIGSIVFLFISFMWHSMIGSRALVKGELETRKFDRYFFFSYVAIYFSFNLLFLFIFTRLFLNIRAFKRKNRQKMATIHNLSRLRTETTFILYPGGPGCFTKSEEKRFI
ncbi:Gamma-aminobutyric acid receptor subunit gamma [Brachionus plicatilis]|uniref:Gamma-aminobutyric acid receptor subunit gamma n=1 Tax=Brachionus plicatilis TaxID=10195 RepID=A0A3M7S1V9_BRAPC|nr:Gamma-aminobutyric acid receptor subunit gamma [Brachionus plicatilis]